MNIPYCYLATVNFIVIVAVTSLLNAHLHTVYDASESGKESILSRSDPHPINLGRAQLPGNSGSNNLSTLLITAKLDSLVATNQGRSIQDKTQEEFTPRENLRDNKVVPHHTISPVIQKNDPQMHSFVKADMDVTHNKESHIFPENVKPRIYHSAEKLTDTSRDGDQCQQMKYWERGLSKHYPPWRSPWTVPDQYVTMELDRGGWNNIRMAMENVIVFAHATGRTFVMPPLQQIYLLNKQYHNYKNPRHGFQDFFPFELLGERMRVISMEEFLKRQDSQGLLPPSLKPVPTQNSLENSKTRTLVWEYLRNPKVAENPDWKADKMGFIFPRSSNLSVMEERQRSKDVDKSVRAFLLGRQPLEYSSYIRNRRVIHFAQQQPPLPRRRLLTQAYLFQFFIDARARRVHLRLVRDYLHYREHIFCTAEKAIRHLLKEGNGSFSSLHVRRNDFQYKKVWLTADDIVKSMGDHLKAGELLYIATDEKNISSEGLPDFFDPLRRRYQLRFLKDVVEVADVHESLGNPNLIGMFEQVVASQGRIFAGAWWSTFTGYITRLRGYYGINRTRTFYYWPPRKYEMHLGDYPTGEFTSSYAREWPVAWTDIDDDVMS